MKTTTLLVLPAGHSGNEVHVGSADPRGLEPELVSKVHDEKEWDREVVGNEVSCVPVTPEEDSPVGE